jgi:phosphoglycolate phosphatase
LSGGFQAVVFDLDGTLIDSAPDVCAAVNVVLAKTGRREISLEEVHGMIGEGAEPLLRRAFMATGAPLTEAALPDARSQFNDAYRADPTKHTIIFPGVRDVLQELHRRGLRLGICTNKPHKSTEIVLEALGMARYFHGVAGGDLYAYRKPDGQHVTSTLDLMAARNLRAVMVGDSGTDAAAARAAGLPMVAVSYGYAKTEPKDIDADVLIDDFSTLPQALDRLAAR